MKHQVARAFHLKAANGQIIAVGQSYLTRQSAEKGIASVKKNAPMAKSLITQRRRPKPNTSFLFFDSARDGQIADYDLSLLKCAGRLETHEPNDLCFGYGYIVILIVLISFLPARAIPETKLSADPEI